MRKNPNISPGLIEILSILGALHSEGLHIKEIIFGGHSILVSAYQDYKICYQKRTLFQPNHLYIQSLSKTVLISFLSNDHDVSTCYGIFLNFTLFFCYTLFLQLSRLHFLPCEFSINEGFSQSPLPNFPLRQSLG